MLDELETILKQISLGSILTEGYLLLYLFQTVLLVMLWCEQGGQLYL